MQGEYSDGFVVWARALRKTIQQSRREENVAPMAQRLTETEERLERMERSLLRLLEEQEFRRELQSPTRGARAEADPR